MTRDLDHAIAAARQIQAERYPDANVLLLAGSVVRGDSTATSDLDIVVLYDQLDHAFRRSFRHDGWPVETFHHDADTLAWFMEHSDGARGVPVLATMVVEAVEVPKPTELTRRAKTMAACTLREGPPAWNATARDAARYALTDMLDDLRAPRSPDDLMAGLADLYPAVAQHFCRARGHWAAKGKHIPRHLARMDPVFARRFAEAFRGAFAGGDTTRVRAIVAEVLDLCGGPLFEGYAQDAPPSARRSDDGALGKADPPR